MGALDESSYRRGLVFGLTMAEVMMLVLFALLLIWMAGARSTQHRKEDATKLRKEVEVLAGKNETLQEEVDEVLGDRDRDVFDELFLKLKLTEDSLKQANEKLKERGSLTESLNRLGCGLKDEKAEADCERSIVDNLKILESVVSSNKVGLKEHPVTEAEIRKELAALEAIRQILPQNGQNAATVAEKCAEEAAEKNEYAQRNETLESIMRSCKKQLVAAGRGTEKPACWTDQAGKPEYIFDVTLKSQSLVVRDNALPNRRVQEEQLPIKGLVFGKDLGPQEFRTQTLALFQWSEAQGCRFFVRVTDVTAAHEKDLYKRQLRTVGEHFYYFEDLVRSSVPKRVAFIQ